MAQTVGAWGLRRVQVVGYWILAWLSPRRARNADPGSSDLKLGASKADLGAIVIAILAALPAGSLAAQGPTRGPAQIILLRHADKPGDPDDKLLSRAGVERAERLASFVTTDAAMIRFGLPVAIFATRTTREGNGQRSQETVAPLARRLGLQVQTPFGTRQYAALAEFVLTQPAYVGKTVLVCWNHTEIPRLAAALGVTPAPPKWDASVFDQVYLISYEQGRVRLTVTRYGGMEGR